MFMVFLNSPFRETLKNALKKKVKKKNVMWWVGLGFSKCTGGSVDFFFAGPGPSAVAQAQAGKGFVG
jgi:hypothetical protein